jgi:spermidine synthase
LSLDQPTEGRSVVRAGGVAFLAAAATLCLQVLAHRMVSAKLLNNYAFLVISLTMLGFAFSGVLLSRWLERFLREANDSLSLCAAGFVLSTLAVSAGFYHASPGLQFEGVLGAFLGEAVRWIPMALLFAVPFAFTGLMLGALLSDPSLPARRIYGLDLLGSALGAFAVIPAIRRFGVEASTLGVGGALLVGTALLLPPRRVKARAGLAVAAVALGLCGLYSDSVFRMRPRAGSAMLWGETVGKPYGLEYMQWDPVARIEVSRIPPLRPENTTFPFLIGSDHAFLDRFQRLITQNDYAFTFMVYYDGIPESLRPVEETIYAAAYEVRSVKAPRVLVIGVGGGFDVLTGLHFDASAVTGVEVNGATLDIVRRVYRDYTRAWVLDPRVRLVEDDGRHYLSTADPSSFDVIQISGVDSYSGTAAAAHVFSENYLYTAEAFDLYLSRLTDQGILCVMRPEGRPPREALRILTTAVGALRRAGVERPAEHVMTVSARSGYYTALLVKKTAFTREEEARFLAWAGGNPSLSPTASPSINSGRKHMYQTFLGMADARRERAFIDAYPFDISPALDDRPFFFRNSFWWHLFRSHPMTETSRPTVEWSLLLLTATIGLAVLLCVYLPIRLLLGRGESVPSRGRYALFFASIGLGYFAIEIALLQKFGLLLGHPNYALSVVLAALLVATGAGALASKSLLRLARNLRYLSYGLSAILLLDFLVVFPLLPRLIHLGFAARVGIVFAFIAPLGVCLGAFLPHGLERLKHEAPSLVPWAWGVNGVFSVLAPVLSVAFSMTWGIGALLLASVPVYLAAGLALPSPAQGEG